MSVMEYNSRFETARSEGIVGFVNGLRDRVARYQTYRRTFDELENLSDRELSDLGIHRSMIRSVAYRSAYNG